MRTPRAGLVAALALALLVSPIGAHDEPVPGVVAYQPVPSVGASLADGQYVAKRERYPRDVGRPVRTLRPDSFHALATRPVVHVPDSPVILVSRLSSGNTGGHPRVDRGVASRASWYDDGPGLYAAAGPALRVGAWRGRRVRVSVGPTAIWVVLSDWCQCYRGTSRERAIDLSPDAFSRLAPLSQGVVKVTVTG